TLTRLPQPAANIPATILFIAASIFYIGVEAAWFVWEAKRSRVAGIAWAIAAFILCALALNAIVLLFAGF
ncbi:MAG: hypothetical protein JOZ20_08685, partial [Sphingomonas sp.]|nr:hypothetical protein [Sphingomonas sp.]